MKPLANYLNPNASWEFGDGRGCLFETCGEELEFVRQQDPSTLWTLIDGDGGDQHVVSGIHFVNRIGYLVSTIASPEGADIEVRFQMPKHSNDESANGVRPIQSISATLPGPLLVSKGTSLVHGKMYLRLYRGRTDPAHQWTREASTVRPSALFPPTFRPIAATSASTETATPARSVRQIVSTSVPSVLTNKLSPTG